MVYTKFERFSAQAVCLAIFHPKRPWILISFESGLIELWDYLMNQKLMSFNEHVGPVYGLAFHPTLPMFASGGHDQKVRLWNIDTGALIYTFVGHQDYVTVVDFHNEQPWLLSGSDDQIIKIWNWQSRSRLADLVGHSNYITAAAFHATSDLVASASLDHTLRVWNLSSLKTKTAGGIQKIAMQVLTLPLTVITKHSLGELHSRPINDMIWTDTTGYTLATASDDGTIRLWSYTPGDSDSPGTLKGTSTLTGFDSYPVIAVKCNAKNMLVAANSNGLLKFYNMENKTYIDSENIPPPIPSNNSFLNQGNGSYPKQGLQQQQNVVGGGSGSVSAPDSKFESFTTHPTQDLMALIYTSGIKIITTQKERPAVTQDREGKLIYYINDNKMYVRSINGSSSGLGTLRKEIAGRNSFGAGRLPLKPSGLQISEENIFPALVTYYDGVNHFAVTVDPSKDENNRGKNGKSISQTQPFSPSACSPSVQVLVPPVLCNGLVSVLGSSRDYISVWDAKQFGWIEDNKSASKIMIDPGAITMLPGGYNRVLLVYSAKIQLLDIVEKKVVATCINNMNQQEGESNSRSGCSIKYSVVGNRIHPMYTGDDVDTKTIPRQMWPYYIAVISSHRVDILKISTKQDSENSRSYKIEMAQVSHVTLKSRVKGGVWCQIIKNRDFFSAVENVAGIDKSIYNEVPKTTFIFCTLTHICYISPATHSKSCSGVLTSVNRTLYPVLLNEEAAKFWYVEKSGIPKAIPLEGSLGVLGESIRISRMACSWMNKNHEVNNNNITISKNFITLVVELSKIVKRTVTSHLGMSPILYLMSMNPSSQNIAEGFIEQMCSNGNNSLNLDAILSLIPYPSLEFIKLLHEDKYLARATSPMTFDKLKVITASVCLNSAREGKVKTALEILWKSLQTGYNDELLRSCLAVFALAGWKEGLEYLKGKGNVGVIASILIDNNCIEDLKKCGYNGLAEWISKNKKDDKNSSIIEFKDIENIVDKEIPLSPSEILEKLVGSIISERSTEDKQILDIRNIVDETKSKTQSSTKKKTWVMMEEDEESVWDVDDNDESSSSEDNKKKKKGKKGTKTNNNDDDDDDNEDEEGWGKDDDNDDSETETSKELLVNKKTGKKNDDDDDEAEYEVKTKIKKFQAPKHNLPPWAQWKGNGHPYLELVLRFYKTGEFDKFFNKFEDITNLIITGKRDEAIELLNECGVTLPKQKKKTQKGNTTLSDLYTTGVMSEIVRLCAGSILPISIPPFPQHIVYYPRTTVPGDSSSLPTPNIKEDNLINQMISIKQLVTKGKMKTALTELREFIPKILFADGQDSSLNDILREAGNYCCGVYSDTQRRILKEQNLEKEGIENHVEELRLHFVFPYYDIDPEHKILALRQGIIQFTKSGLAYPAALLANKIIELSKQGSRVEKKILDKMRKTANAEIKDDEYKLFGSECDLEEFNVENFALDTMKIESNPSYCPICNCTFSSEQAGNECPCCMCGVLLTGKRKLFEVENMEYKL